MRNRTVAEKNERLFQHGINFNDLPTWQKRGAGVYWQCYAILFFFAPRLKNGGAGVYWQCYDKTGFNPLTGESVVTQRRRLYLDLDLPLKDAYSAFIVSLLVEEAP